MCAFFNFSFQRLRFLRTKSTFEEEEEAKIAYNSIMHINYPMCAHQKNINIEIYVIVWHVVRRLAFVNEAHTHIYICHKNIRLYLLMFNAHKVRQTCQFEMDKHDRRVSR